MSVACDVREITARLTQAAMIMRHYNMRPCLAVHVYGRSALYGLAHVAVGGALHFTGVVPMNKLLWSVSS